MGKFNTIEDYWNRVNKNTESGCWEWIGRKEKDGYGSFAMNKQWRQTHRWAMIFNGHNIDGKVVCHKCDNPSCVNPDHLFIGTQADNVADMISKGRYVKPQGRFNDETIIKIRNSNESMKSLSNLYGVSTTTIFDIKHCKIYKDVA